MKAAIRSIGRIPLLCLTAALLSGHVAPAAAAGGGQQTRPMTPEDVVAVRDLSQPRISADGHRVAFVVRRGDLEANRVRASIWLHDAERGETIRLTHADASHSDPRWSPDGGRLTFLSDREEHDQIWQIRIDGGEPRQLSDSPTPVEAYAWAPDGRTIAYTAPAQLPESVREAREAGDDEIVYDRPGELPALWILDVDTGHSRKLTDGDLAIHELAFAPDGNALVVAGRPSTILDRIGETELYRVDLPGGAVTRLTDNAAVEGGVRFAPEGASVLFTAPDAERFVNGESKLFRLDLATGEVARIAAHYPHGLWEATVLPAGGRVAMIAGVGVTQRLVEVDLDTGTVEERVAEPGAVLAFDVAHESGRIAYLFGDARSLPELWLLDPGAAAGERVTGLNPQQSEWNLGDTRAVRWRSADGAEVEGLLTLPSDHREGDRHPLVVKLHGGPEAAELLVHEPGYIDYHQVLAGAGWAVLRPNYRGGIGYGDDWVRGMNGDTGGGDYRDIMTGVDHVIALGVADPERMVVMGWSWGGISTGWIVTQTDRFAAASAGAMVSDHFSVFGQADLTFDVEHFYIGGSPWEDPARYLAMSPIGHVMNATTPTLLLHGADDERCPLPQSVEFYKGLRAAGVTAELVVYPREPHVFREPRHQLDKIEREMAWFERWALRPVDGAAH